MSDSNFADGFLTGANLAGIAGNIGDAIDNGRAVQGMNDSLAELQKKLMAAQQEAIQMKYRAMTAESLLEEAKRTNAKLKTASDIISGDDAMYYFVENKRLQEQVSDLQGQVGSQNQKVDDLEHTILGWYVSNEALRQTIRELAEKYGVAKDEVNSRYNQLVVEISDKSNDPRIATTATYIASKEKLNKAE